MEKEPNKAELASQQNQELKLDKPNEEDKRPEIGDLHDTYLEIVPTTPTIIDQVPLLPLKDKHKQHPPGSPFLPKVKKTYMN